MNNYRNFKRVEPTDNRKAKNKIYAKLLLVIVSLVVIVCGVSYAFYTLTIRGNKKVEVVAGTFNVEFKDGNVANISKGIPMTDNEGLTDEDNITTFSVTNTGDIDAMYSISLEEVDIDANTMDKKWIKYSLKENDGDWSTPQSLSNGLLLCNNKYLKSGETVNYQLKIWLAYEADNSVQGKKFSAKIVINAIQSNAQLGNITQPVINISNTSINVIKGDTLYRDPIPYEVVDANRNPIDIGKVVKTYEYFDGETIRPVDAVNVNNTGIYYIYYRVTDDEGNTGCTVVSINVCEPNNGSVPIITLNGSTTVEVKKGSTYIDEGAFAIDDEDGELEVKTIGDVDTSVVGEYIVKYIAKDSNGNIVSVIRTVKVVDSDGKDDNNDDDDKDKDKDKDGYTIEIGDIAINSEDSNKIDIPVTVKSKGDNKVKVIFNDSSDELTIDDFNDAVETSDFNEVFNVTSNGTYYVWVLDSKNNIKSKEVVVDIKQEEQKPDSKPICRFSDDNYMTTGEKLIDLICTDESRIENEFLENNDFKIDNNDVAEILYVSGGAAIENGYKYTIMLNGHKEGSFNITLNEGVISNIYGNKNDSVTKQMEVRKIKNDDVTIDGDLGDSDLSVEDGKLFLKLDMNSSVKLSLSKYEDNLKYTVDSEIVTVDDLGNITANDIGTATIKCVDKESGATIKIFVTVVKKIHVTYIKNGKGVKKIAKLEKNNTTCELNPSNPNSCSINLPAFDTELPYEVVGWSEDADSHIGYTVETELEIKDDVTLYTISKTPRETFTVLWNENGSELEGGEDFCYVESSYNDEEYDEGCYVEKPIVKPSDNTPNYVGWNTDISAKEDMLGNNPKVKLTSKNNGSTYYAITKSNAITYTATFNENGYAASNISYGGFSCTIDATYNGKRQPKSCKVELPSVDIAEGYSLVGWNSDKEATEGLDDGANIVIQNDINLYVITKKDAKNIRATFHKQGLGVSAIGSTTLSCTTDEVYNPYEAVEDVCTINMNNIPEIIINENDLDKYEVIGWNEDSNAHEKSSSYTEDGGLTITANSSYYSITKTKEAVLTAKWDANGTQLQGNDDKFSEVESMSSCIIPEVYNETEENRQASSCSIVTPTIIKDGYIINGYVESGKEDFEPSFGSNETIFLTNNKSKDTVAFTTGKTWKARTHKVVRVIWHANGAKFKQADFESEGDITSECSIIDNDPSCDIESPEIIRSGYNIIGYNTNANAQESVWAHKETKSVSENQEYYAITSKDLTAKFNYYNDSTQSVTVTCVIKNKDDDCNVDVPAVVANSTGPNGSKYVGLSSNLNSINASLLSSYKLSSNETYNAVYAENVNPKFYYYDSIGNQVLYSDTVTGIRSFIIKQMDGEYETVESDVEIPSVVSDSKGIDNATYIGVSANTNDKNILSDITTANNKYYAVYKGTWKLTYGRDNKSVSAITKNGDSCDNYQTTNGSVYSADGDNCDVTLPDITLNTGYKNAKWYDYDNGTSASPGDQYEIEGTKELIAKGDINTYTVSYNCTANGGVCNIPNDTKEYNSHPNLTPNATKDGYDFLGWNTKKDATAALTEAEIKDLRVTSDMTLFAIFRKSTTISLNGKSADYTGSKIEANQASVLDGNNSNPISYTYYTDNKCTTKVSTSTGAATTGAAPINAGTYYAQATTTALNGTTVKSGCVSHIINKKAVTVTAANQTITYGEEITSGVSEATLTSQVSGHTLSAITLTASTGLPTKTGTIAPSGATIKDASGNNVTSNYTITYANGNLTINKKELSVSVTASDKVYDGNDTATCAVTLSGAVNDHTPSAVSATGKFADSNVGDSKTVTCSGISLSGSFSQFYQLNTTSETTTADITQKQVTVTAADQTVTYGTAITNATSKATLASQVSGHSLSAITLEASTADATTAGKITPSGAIIKNASGSDVTSNYSITYKTGKLVINKANTATTGSCKTLTYTGGNQTLAEGATNASYENNSGKDVNDKGYAVTVIADSNYTFSDGETSKTLYCSIARSKTATTGSCKTLTYTGGNQTLAEGATNATYENNTGKDVNDKGYKVTVTAGSNYAFSDGETSKELNCTIGKKTVTVTASNQTITYGEEITNATSKATLASQTSGHTLGAITLTASTTEATTAGTITPSEATIKDASGSDVTSNYTVTYKTGKLVINKANTATKGHCKSDTYSAYEGGLSYNGSSQTLATGGSYVTYKNNSGTGVGTYTVTAISDGNHTFSDGSTTKTLSCTIGKSKTATIGSCKKPSYTGCEQPLAGGGSHVIYQNNMATNAGSYKLLAVAEDNYLFEDGRDSIYMDCPIELSKTATTGSCETMTYTGGEQTLASGATNATYGNNTGTNAGYYTVNVYSNVNYAFSDGSTEATLSCWINPLVKSASFSKGLGASAIGATTGSCSISSGSTESCSVTLPSITLASGYSNAYWSFNISNYIIGATGNIPGKSIKITSNSASATAKGTDTTPPSFDSSYGTNKCIAGKSCFGTVTVKYYDAAGAPTLKGNNAKIRVLSTVYSIESITTSQSGNILTVTYRYSFTTSSAMPTTKGMLELSGGVVDASGNEFGGASITFLDIVPESAYYSY